MTEFEIKAKLAKIIVNSSLWEIGTDGHNVLSELVETIYQELFDKRSKNEN